MEKNQQQDELLFAQLRRAKRRKRRKVLITMLVLLALAAVGLNMAVRYFRGRVMDQIASDAAEVKSSQAVSGRIHTTVSGSGTLSYPEQEDVTLPDGVEAEELLVVAGDSVTAGTPLAKVDVNSVMTALADAQTKLEDLDKQINSAKNDTVRASMTSAVAGRVKRIYAQKDDNVVDVMTEHGALALISLDGWMSVRINADLKTGDTVTVRTGDKTYPGTVESCISGVSVVCLTDNGPAYGAEATVEDAEGSTLGTGTLEIHNLLSITGYAGTIGWVNISENQPVYAGSTLFSLSNTSYTANYDALLRSRSETEKTLNTLIALLRSGSVEAPFDGVVISAQLPDSETASIYASDTALAVLARDQQVCVTVSVDEADILSVEVGQSAQVTVSSIGEDTYPGTVTEISRIGTSQSGVTGYSAVVTLDKTPQMLAGMSASVEIQIQSVDDVVLIPADALHRTRDMYYVYTGYDEVLGEYTGMVTVETGVSNSSFVEIVSGLEPGDTVYYTEKAAGFDFFQMPGMSGNVNFGDRGGPIRGGANFGGSQGGPNGMGNARMPGMGG